MCVPVSSPDNSEDLDEDQPKKKLIDNRLVAKDN